MKTATEKYNAVLEGKMAKKEFVRQMRQQFPNFVSQFNGFEDSVQILKNKGMIFEVKKEEGYKTPEVNLPLDVIERGVDAELEAAGIDSAGNVTKEQYLEAKRKAMHNLKKDMNHYLNLMAGESSAVDKNDKMKEVKKGEEKDVLNGMKKAELKEEAEGVMREALNKDIKVFGTDLGKRLQQAGFEVKYLDGRISDDQRNYINTNTGFVALEPFQNEGLQSLFVYFNPKEANKVKAVVDKFQTSDYSGRPIQRGWTAKQVQGAINPGDIYKGAEATGRIDFYRLAQVDTKVKDLAEINVAGHDIRHSDEKQNIIHVAREIRVAYGDIPGFNGLLKDFLHTHMDDVKSGAVTDPVAEFNDFVDLNYDRLDEKDGYNTDPNTTMHIDDEEWEKEMGREVKEEKADKDYDGDGKIESGEEEYKGSKDKAIKKAMGNESQLKEAVKSIIKKVLSEEVVNEAATAKLAQYGEEYADFEGVKQIINQLENIVTEVESFYDRVNNKVKDIFAKVGEVKNEEGLKVGGFIAPSIEAAFRNDLRPVQKNFLVGIELPKVKTISQADIDRVNAGGELEEEPKQNVFSPVYESKKK